MKCSEQFTRIGQLFPFNINILFSLLLFSVAIAVFICFLDRRIKLVLTGFRPRFPGLVKHTRGAAYNIQLVAHYWWIRRHISLRSMFDQGHWWGERAGMADYITTSFIWIITRDKILRKYTSSLTEPVLRRPSSSERQLTRPTETQWSGSQWNDDEEITVINNWYERFGFLFCFLLCYWTIILTDRSCGQSCQIVHSVFHVILTFFFVWLHNWSLGTHPSRQIL